MFTANVTTNAITTTTLAAPAAPAAPATIITVLPAETLTTIIEYTITTFRDIGVALRVCKDFGAVVTGIISRRRPANKSGYNISTRVLASGVELSHRYCAMRQSIDVPPVTYHLFEASLWLCAADGTWFFVQAHIDTPDAALPKPTYHLEYRNVVDGDVRDYGFSGDGRAQLLARSMIIRAYPDYMSLSDPANAPRV